MQAIRNILVGTTATFGAVAANATDLEVRSHPSGAQGVAEIPDQ